MANSVLDALCIPVVLKLQWVGESPGGPFRTLIAGLSPGVPGSVGLGICISNRLSGDADATDLGPPL